MANKLKKIFTFLKENRSFNNRVHTLDYVCALTPYKRTEDKVLSLLFQILNTQSQPKLDKIKLFAQQMQANKQKLKTFKGLLVVLGGEKKVAPSYELLFNLLKKMPAWGNKTAALFVKAIYRIHHGKQRQLAFYSDVPKLKKIDKLFIPVDTVILNIFSKLQIDIPNTFIGINNYIKQDYTEKDMELWDDLWYWGFITQKGSAKNRKIEFNESKYWVLLHTDKREHVIKEVNKKANRFISLLK